MSHALVGSGIATFIVLAGVMLFWYRKVKVRKQLAVDTFASFFLGGGDIGNYLTANNNWGICFAFANAMWYYAFLGYYYGIYVFLLQIAWSVAVIFLGKYLTSYLRASKDGTIHGFIGHYYGTRTSLLAATATILGYTLNIGFELFYSAHLLVTSAGIPDYELMVAVLLALFVGGYCVVGGYRSSVVTDPMQNWLGVLALLILLGLVLPAVYQKSSFHALFSLANTTYPGTSFITGVVVFSLFFNLVDMANWQSIAGNRNLPTGQLRSVSIGLYRSAAVQMLAPAALGTLFGAALRLTSPGIPDDGYFRVALRPLLAFTAPWQALVLGLVYLGFIGVAISSAGSYLLAAMQTLSIDIVKRKALSSAMNSGGGEDARLKIEQSVLDWVKRMMIPVCVGMTLIFALLYDGLSKLNRQGLAFQFQFVMYGAAVTLVPAVLFPLLRQSERRSARAGFWSIFVGLLCVVVFFAAAEGLWPHLPTLSGMVNSDDIVNLTPLFGLTSSFCVFVAIERMEARNAR